MINLDLKYIYIYIIYIQRIVWGSIKIEIKRKSLTNCQNVIPGIPWYLVLPGGREVRGRGQALRAPGGGGALPAEEAVRPAAQTLQESLLKSEEGIFLINYVASTLI